MWNIICYEVFLLYYYETSVAKTFQKYRESYTSNQFHSPLLGVGINTSLGLVKFTTFTTLSVIRMYIVIKEQ